MAPRVGLEPTAYRLTAGCSTIELPWNGDHENFRKRARALRSALIFKTGNDLLSRDPAVQVPLALESLTAVFGMGTGVASPP